MDFEFDEKKSRANLAKHGIDFVEAQTLWDDPNVLGAPARVADEPRLLVIGAIRGAMWTAVVTFRGERVRIISVRRSREKEVEHYEGP